MAADEEGNIVTSTDPTGPASAWKVVAADGADPGGFQALSCAGASLCVGADLNGNVVASANPTGGATDWTLEAIDSPAGGSNEVGPIACVSPSLCVVAATGSAGNFVFTSTNPTGGASAWASVTGVAQNAPLAAIACVSASLCVAEDVATDMITTTDPTGPATGWIGFDVGTPNHESGGVSCSGTSLCVAVGGQDIVTSTNP